MIVDDSIAHCLKAGIKLESYFYKKHLLNYFVKKMNPHKNNS